MISCVYLRFPAFMPDCQATALALSILAIVHTTVLGASSSMQVCAAARGADTKTCLPAKRSWYQCSHQAGYAAKRI
jgi:hypothetical protein